MLIGITVIWGWTFLIVKDAVNQYPVMPFLALRFALAAVLLAPLAMWGAYRRRTSPPAITLSRKHSLGIGCLVGTVLAAGYVFQTYGLQTTTATNAGLLTGLFVILTPVFD